jgi:hypothetical protein
MKNKVTESLVVCAFCALTPGDREKAFTRIVTAHIDPKALKQELRQRWTVPWEEGETPRPLHPVMKIIAWPRDVKKPKRTHCFYGHRLTPKNIYTPPSGGSSKCRVCLAMTKANYRQKHRSVIGLQNPEAKERTTQ